MKPTIYHDHQLNSTWRHYTTNIRRSHRILGISSIVNIIIATLLTLYTDLGMGTMILITLFLAVITLGVMIAAHVYIYVTIRKNVTLALGEIAQKLYVADEIRIRNLIEDPTGTPHGFIASVIVVGTDDAGDPRINLRQITYDGTAGQFAEHALIGVPQPGTATER